MYGRVHRANGGLDCGELLGEASEPEICRDTSSYRGIRDAVEPYSVSHSDTNVLRRKASEPYESMDIRIKYQDLSGRIQEQRHCIVYM